MRKNLDDKLKLKFQLVLFFIHIMPFCVAQNIHIKDCESKEGIEGVLVIKDGIFLGGETNKDGNCNYPSGWKNKKVSLSRLGYKDTTILLNANNFCMNKQAVKIEEVLITTKFYSVEEQFMMFIEKSAKNMQSQAFQNLYKFYYAVQVPDSNWNIEHHGVLNLYLNEYDNKNDAWWNSTVCSLSSMVDSLFWHSKNYKEYRTDRFIDFIAGDGMRKGRYLRNKFNKQAQFVKLHTDDQYIFEISHKANGRHYKTRAIFGLDSLIKEVDYKWLSDLDKPINFILMKGSNHSFEINIKYSEGKNARLEQLKGTASYKTNDGILHINKMELAKYSDSLSSCKEWPIFLHSDRILMDRYNHEIRYRRSIE